MGTRGFTLIELRVVTAIIAIPAAILLPIMRSAKPRAVMARCINSLKRMLAACVQCATDKGGIMPWSSDDAPDSVQQLPNWCGHTSAMLVNGSWDGQSRWVRYGRISRTETSLLAPSTRSLRGMPRAVPHQEITGGGAERHSPGIQVTEENSSARRSSNEGAPRWNETTA